MIILVYSSGLYSLGFALFHLFFPKIFNWNTDLEKLTQVNKAIVKILNLKLVYIFVSIAVLCFIFPVELIGTKLGKVIMLGMAGFWLGRAIEQIVFFKVDAKISVRFTVLFIMGMLLFASPVVCKFLFPRPCKIVKPL